MNSPDDFPQVKRGRPKKRDESTKRKQQKTSEDQVLTPTRRYFDMLKSYSKENYNQKLRNMINSVTKLVKMPNKFLQLPLQNFLEESVKQLMVNEIELSEFTLILEKLDLVNIEVQIEELLKICFFLSKQKYESDEVLLGTMKDVLKAQFKNFEQNLEKILPFVSIPIFDVFPRFEKLSRLMYTTVNYTYYVDDIIRQSPPYQISDRKLEKKGEDSPNKPFRIKERKVKPEPLKENPFKQDNEKFGDQDLLGANYFDLRPLDEGENYLFIEQCEREAPAADPYECLFFYQLVEATHPDWDIKYT